REDFYDRAWFIPLSNRQNRTVASRFAEALGVRRGNDEDASKALTRSLRARQILLVVDNCESAVVEAAEITKELLGISERVRVLATSRQPLGILGEKCVRLGG